MKRLAFVAALALAGCASTSPKDGFRDVAQKVEQQSGRRVMWDQGGDDDAKVKDAIAKLLASELSVDAAVQVALLDNPTLIATYEELSIAQADLVQAGLLKNPVFTVGRTAWEAEHIDPNLFASVEQDVLDLIMLPARKKIAKSQLEQAKHRLLGEILDLAGRTRTAFYALQAAQQTAAMRREIVEAAEAAVDLATRQYEAGNLYEFALANERAGFAQLQLGLAQSDLTVTQARADLAKLLGVWGPTMSFRVPERLPELPAEEVSLEHLESLAVGQRAELAAATQQHRTLHYALNLAKTTRWFGTVTVGAEVGRLRSGNVSIGPSATIEIPLFDQRQAAIARLEAMVRAAASTERAVAIDIRADVNAVRARLVAARRTVEFYRDTILPTRRNLTRLAQVQYDAMLLSVYQLLQIRQQEVAAMAEYLEALREYWTARSDLERAVGGRLPVATHPAHSP
ncbi:MAG: Copper tolerance protein [Labilithrix sp.]|nr:Copper tolerance protein [Labilithrix sp.]